MTRFFKVDVLRRPTSRSVIRSLETEHYDIVALDAEPPEVQEAFQFLLATAMHEAGKFELLNVVEVEGRWHYTFSGAGDT